MVLHDAGRERVEQQFDAVGREQRIGRALERRHVVGLRVDLAEDQVRRIEAVQRTHAVEQLVGDAVHDLADLAVDVRVQPAEIGHAGGGAHAAEKAVALDQQHPRAVARRAGGGGDAGRAAAEHDDVEFAEHRHLARRLGDQVGDSGVAHRGVGGRNWRVEW